MKRSLIALVLVCTTTVAYAGPHQVLVLHAEGSADAASRTTIESHILRLAKNIDGKVEAGDITLTDAAAAAGCNAADAACKDEILATFAVDELVATTVTATNGGLNVTVRRLTKGSAPRAAASLIAPGKPPDAKLDQDIGPLFGAGFSTTPLTEAKTTTPAKTTTTTTTTPPVQTTTPPKQTQQTQSHMTPISPYDGPMPEDPATGPVAASPIDTSAPAPAPVDNPSPSRKWEKIGIGVGAGLVLISFILWTQAAGVQDDIDAAPTDTPADFVHLRDLEQRADGLAGGGNLLFIGGLIIGGASGFYYWKKGRSHPATATAAARITPTVFPHGAGVVLSFGGGQ